MEFYFEKPMSTEVGNNQFLQFVWYYYRFLILTATATVSGSLYFWHVITIQLNIVEMSSAKYPYPLLVLIRL